MTVTEGSMNHPPDSFRADRDLPRGFLDYFLPLHAPPIPEDSKAARHGVATG